jgi:hypothetical protein
MAAKHNGPKPKPMDRGKTTLSAVRKASQGLGPLERNAVLQGSARYLRAQKAQAMFRKAQGSYGGLAGATMTPVGNGIAYGSPQWYNPLIGSEDKYYFPASQERQNTIWRTYYEMDPVIGSATDLFSDLPWSDFSLSGIEDRSILHIYEDSLNKLNLLTLLPSMTKELIMKGKVIPHLIFSNTLGYWIHCAVHDPSYVGVQGRGIAGVPPLLDLIPTPEMQWMAKSNDPRMVEFRRSLPQDVLLQILSGQPIPLKDINVTYIARKTCIYDVMGTSLYTRLFQVRMYEDALWNAALEVARRNAVPLRVFKLGDPTSGWFPDQSDYDSFLAQLEQAELDPAAILIYHFGLDIEYVGTSDKFLKISDENDLLTKLKLAALGVPESILGGEATFSSADAGLQVMVERLAALRQKFVREWIIPKILKPIAVANEFYKSSPLEALTRIRKGIPIKTDDDLVIPTIRWNKSLEVRDSFLMEVYKDLMTRGFVSNKTYASMAGGIDLDSEVENLAEDKRLRDRAKEILGEDSDTLETQKRSSALLKGIVDLVRSGSTDVKELSHLSGTSLEALPQTLETLGVRDASTLVERISSTIGRGKERRRLTQDIEVPNSATLLSGA